jgi:hypothetical protein
MEAAADAIVKTWAERGLVGAVVLSLGVVVVLLWRWADGKQSKVEALHEARRQDNKECTDRYIEMLTKTIESNNRMADGMEAFERVVDKVVKP